MGVHIYIYITEYFYIDINKKQHDQGLYYLTLSLNHLKLKEKLKDFFSIMRVTKEVTETSITCPPPP